MTSDNGVSEASDEESKRERSSISFPYHDLDSASGVAGAVHRLGDHCDLDQLAAELKFSGVDNGAFRGQIATARHFGLVTTGRGSVTLTNLGAAIVDPAREAQARAQAFLHVPLYRAVYDRFRGRTLPPAQGLENVFAELGVAAKQTDKARHAMQRSAEQAGYFGAGRDRLVAPALAAAETDSQRDDGGEKGTHVEEHTGRSRSTALHPLVSGLVETLPPVGSPWSEPEREQWLTAAKSIFALIYRPNNPLLPPRAGTLAAEGTE